MADLSAIWRGEYVPLGGGPFAGEMMVAHTANLQLGCFEYSRGHSHFGVVPARTYAFVIPLEGERGVYSGRELSELDIATGRSGEETAYHAPGPTRHLVICAAEHLLAGALRSGRHATGTLLRFADGERRVAFLRDAQRLLASALQYPEFLTQPARAAIFERSLIERLLCAVRSELRVAPIAERHRLARLAHRYLLEHVRENVSLLDLCRDLAANERTLLLGFTETYGAAPMAYLRGIRLNGAMRDLRSGRESTVTEVASEWGFFHFGRFSADYRRAFGETPRKTLQGARAALVPA